MKPAHYQQAARWFRKATEQGDAGAQLHLGFMHLFGQDQYLK